MRRILLLENKTLPLHRLRTESRRSGVPFIYERAATGAQFSRLLARPPAAVVSSLDGLPGMPVAEIADQAHRANVPLFLIGGDSKEEREQLFTLTGSFAASFRRSRLPWLPMLLERAERDFRAADAGEDANHLDQASEQMLSLQKLAIVGRLAGSIAHEINNPLESITNLVYLLGIDEQLPVHLRPYVALAEQELKRVTQISNQTLTFYRETQNPVRVQLSALLDEVLTLFRRRLAEKKITVTRRYDSEDPILLFPGEMRQVFANLVANAIEATESGGRVILRIHCARRHSTQGSVEGVRVLFADTGSGIAPDARARLGQPFFTTKGQRGTGLGLWVSRAIVKRYHGQLQLRSTTNPARHGTVFSIFLPLNLGPHMVESVCSRSTAAAPPSLPSRGLRLLAGGN